MANIQIVKLLDNQDISTGSVTPQVNVRSYDSYALIGTVTSGAGNLIVEGSCDGFNWYKTTKVLTVSGGQDIYGEFSNDLFLIRIYADTDLSGVSLTASMREHF